jgi:hypothetical protein
MAIAVMLHGRNNMKIQKGQLIKVHDCRKGNYIGIASADFDTEADDFYPVNLAQDKPVNGLQGRPKWFKGEDIPCRRGLSEISAMPTVKP